MDVAFGPKGIQGTLAKSQFNIDGTDAIIGQVEPNRPGLEGFDNTLTNFFHPLVKPAGVADINIAPPSQNTNVGAHATSVAGVMIATANPTVGPGLAENARLFSSATASGLQPFSVKGAEWVRQQGAKVINFSYGLQLENIQYLPPGGNVPVPPGGPPPTNPALVDGNSLFPLYLDYIARQHDVLSVVAGNEYTFGSRRDYTGEDAYNNITVAATAQSRAGGRYDQVSNINLRFTRAANDPVEGPFTGPAVAANNTDDGRIKTDIVAPGASNIQVGVLDVNTRVRRVIQVFRLPALGADDLFLPFGFHSPALPDPPPNPRPPFSYIFENAPFQVIPNSNLNMPSLIDSNPPAVNQPPGVNPPGGVLTPAGDGFFDSAGFERTSGTSFAAPQVTAAAALFRKYADSQGIVNTHLSTKAATLNSASKHLMSKIPTNPAAFAAIPAPFPAAPHNFPFPAVPDSALGQAWPLRYAGRVDAGDPKTIKTPVDEDMGVGQHNVLAGLRQLQKANRDDLAVREDTVAADARKEFAILAGGPQLKAGSLVTATLTWDRFVDSTNVQNIAAYKDRSFQDLDFELAEAGSAEGEYVFRSYSTKDNVEHIYFNVPKDGKYVLRVHNSGTDAAKFGVSWAAGTTDGLAFSVAPATRGIVPAPGSGKWPNDVNSLGASGPAAFQTQSEIFVSGGDERNMARLSGALQTRSRVGPFNGPPAAMSLIGGGPGVLGLTSNDTQAGTDNVGGLSWGRDGTLDPDDPLEGLGGTLVFSIKNSSTLYKSQEVDAFGEYTSDVILPSVPANTVYRTAKSLGLDDNMIGPNGPQPADDLDALELDSPLKDPDGAGPLFALDRDGDGMPNSNVYFTLAPGSPSQTGARTPDDIYVAASKDPGNAFDLNATGAFSFATFAEGPKLGLQAGDIIDAIVLSDIGDIGTLNAGTDEVLFSLAAGSPSLAGGKTAGDVFYSKFNDAFSTFATAAFLGIAGMDLDALDIASVPEPASAALAIGALAAALVRRRRF
jgi:hypothetical protein